MVSNTHVHLRVTVWWESWRAECLQPLYSIHQESTSLLDGSWKVTKKLSPFFKWCTVLPTVWLILKTSIQINKVNNISILLWLYYYDMVGDFLELKKEENICAYSKLQKWHTLNIVHNATETNIRKQVTPNLAIYFLDSYGTSAKQIFKTALNVKINILECICFI